MSKQLIDMLSRFLANTYTVYLKTQNYHWNVTGPFFQTMHLMFEGQYQDLALAVDEIAERIRALNAFAPASYAQFSKSITVKDAPKTPPKAMDMVHDLKVDHETLAKQAHEIIEAAEEAGDDATADLCVVRKRIHEKTAWMLRSALE